MHFRCALGRKPTPRGAHEFPPARGRPRQIRAPHLAPRARAAGGRAAGPRRAAAMRQRHRVSGCERWSGQSHHGPCCSRWGAGDARVGSACSLVAPEEFIMHRIEKCDKGRPAGHTHATSFSDSGFLNRGTGPPPRPACGAPPTHEKRTCALIRAEGGHGGGTAAAGDMCCETPRFETRRAGGQSGTGGEVETSSTRCHRLVSTKHTGCHAAAGRSRGALRRAVHKTLNPKSGQVPHRRFALVLATLRARPARDDAGSVVLISLT